MNVDLFQNNPAWWYYFIVAVPLAFLVIGLYLMFRYSSSFSTMVKRKILSSPTTTDATTDDSEAHVGVSTVLRWAAATGQIDTVAGLLGSDTYAMTSLAAGLGSEDTLIAAVTNGHEEIARLLLQRDGQVVDETDAQGATALHHAAGKGSLELVMLLLRHGANVHRSDSGGRKPLEWAMENRDEKCTAAILLAMYDGAQSVDPDTASLPSSIHVACAHFDLAMVKRLISAGYSRTTKDSQGRIPLFSALEANQDFFIEVADLYTKNELRDTDFHGLGLLHSAVELGLLGVIKYLVGCGLDVRLKTANELETPLHFVAKTKEGANRLWIMEYLVANGASKSAINSAGSTLAHLIAREDRPDSPTLLTSFVQRDKWRLKTQDSTGRTPVHIAAMWGRLPILKEMLKIADREILSIQDGEKLLAADLAARAGHLEAYQLLDLLHDGSGKETKAHRFDALVGQLVAKNDLPGLKQAYTQPGKSQPPLELSGRVFEAAIDASASNIINYFLDNDRSWITKRYGSYNGTVLVNAIARGTPDFVDFLLDAGAPVDGQDNSGWNALHVAAFWGLRPATTRRILEKSAAGKDEKDAYGWIPYDLAYFYYREDLYEILAPASLAKHTLPWWKGENVELGTGFEDEEFGGNVHPGSPGNEGKESRLPRFETTASSWAAGVDVVGRLAELAG
ncbi:ankyrin repeat-containing domain protein [Cercophora scortea]|uniref:Ankyrin repeat-containing domain protein n=1 Tax=Cercophora scortea TaxID=314031 RepID=A0AAE0IXJ0_9PEZI|nr:ankyrin repeat-containing domain protein [Cercophora scortea]